MKTTRRVLVTMTIAASTIAAPVASASHQRDASTNVPIKAKIKSVAVDYGSVPPKKKNRFPVTVEVAYTGKAPLTAKCRIDDEKAVACFEGATFKRVPPGKHEVTLKVTDGAGRKASDVAEFRVKKIRKR